MKKGHTKEFWWTREKVRKLAELYEEGYTMDEIGERCGIRRQRVHQLFNAFGIKARRKVNSEQISFNRCMRRKLVPKETVVELYSNKRLKLTDILKELKISQQMLYKILKAYEIPRRDNIPSRISPLTYDVLYPLYIEQNLTGDEVARRLGRVPATVKNKLSTLGIKKQQILNDKSRLKFVNKEKGG